METSNANAKKDEIYNLIILDESGSMEDIKKFTISGFNELIQTIKSTQEEFPEQKNFVTFVSFNTMGIRTHLNNVPVEEIYQLDGKSYRPNAGTPLYDAVGFACTRLKHELEDKKDVHVITTILTDGLENASREYNGNMISNLIEDLKSHNWLFNYIGTDHDVVSASKRMSIDNTLSFSKNIDDIQRMFTEERSARVSFARRVHNRTVDLKNYYIDNDKKEDEK